MTAHVYRWDEVPFALTLIEAGSVLGISRSSVYRLVQSGELRSLRVSERKLVVPRAALMEFLGDRREDAPISDDEGNSSISDSTATALLEVADVR